MSQPQVNAAQAADRLQQILQWQPDSLAALSEVEPLLDLIKQSMPLLRLWAAAGIAKQANRAETVSAVEALAQDLDDTLALDHHLHLIEFFATNADLPDLVADALDVFSMALEQAETARLALWRIIHAADLQQHAV